MVDRLHRGRDSARPFRGVAASRGEATRSGGIHLAERKWTCPIRLRVGGTYEPGWSLGGGAGNRRVVWSAKYFPWLGRDFFHKVVLIAFGQNSTGGMRPDDDVRRQLLTRVQHLPHVKEVYFISTFAHPELLRDWPHPEAVEKLSFDVRPIPPGCLNQFGRFTRLRKLGFNILHVEPKGWETLARLRGLEELALYFYDEHGVPDDDALRAIGNLTSLKELRIDGVNVSGEGWRHLAGLCELEHVTLRAVKTETRSASLLECPQLHR